MVEGISIYPIISSELCVGVWKISNMKVGIKEVAKEANVSVTAVSLALNNKPGVSEATREKILDVASKLGYQPTAKSAEDVCTVRFLQIPRHGHALNTNHENFIGNYLNGIMDSAQLHNITIEIESFLPMTPIESIVQKINSNTQTAGYIILATELSANDVQTLLATEAKIVFIDTYIYSVAADYVNMNNMQSVFSIVKYFKDSGHTDIGIIKSSVGGYNFTLREQAFVKAMSDLGLELLEKNIFDVDSTFEGAYKEMLPQLINKPKLPTALFASNDIIALGCIRAFKESGYRLPDDISIFGFDNIPMSEMSSPSLSTINVPNRQIGQVAVDMLYLKLQHISDREPMVSLVNSELVHRNSVKRL